MNVNFEDLMGLVDCATKGSIEIVIGGFVDYEELIKKLEPGFHPKADGESFGYDYRPSQWLEVFHEGMDGKIDRHAVVDISKKEYLRIKIAVL